MGGVGLSRISTVEQEMTINTVSKTDGILCHKIRHKYITLWGIGQHYGCLDKQFSYAR